MDGLKRSEVSFRRQGSSGLVWDDKLFSGELKEGSAAGEDGDDKVKGGESKEKEASKALHVREQTYRTVKDVVPTIDPPSPKVSTCGICSMFGAKPQQKKTTHKPQQQHHRQPQPKPKRKL